MGITVQLPFPRGVSRSLVVQDRFHLTGLGFGVMLSVYAGGYLLGYVVAPAVAARFPRARICVGSLLGAAGGFSLVAAAANPLLAGLGLAFTGLSSAQVDVVAISYRQAAVPDRVLGRVLAGFLFVVHGMVPIGAFVGGLVASWAGVGATYVVAALSLALAAPYLWSAPRGAELDPDRLDGGSPES